MLWLPDPLDNSTFHITRKLRLSSQGPGGKYQVYFPATSPEVGWMEGWKVGRWAEGHGTMGEYTRRSK